MSHGMGQPPAKRQKRPIVLSDSDEEDSEDDTPEQPIASNRSLRRRPQFIIGKQPLAREIPTRTRSKAPSTRKTSSTTTSPSKARPRAAPTSKSVTKRKSITSFFSTNSDQQLTLKPTPSSQTRLEAPEPIDDDEDLIKDDDSHDEAFALATGLKPYTQSALDRRKGSFESSQQGGSQTSFDNLPPPSQRFLKPTKPVQDIKVSGSRETEEKNVDKRPWSERFGPLNLDELAVHKKKVQDIRGWLEDVYQGRSKKRLLLLKGPAGAGKTTTVSLLAKDMDIGITEWKNPFASELSEKGYVSMAAQFEEFLGRGGKFGNLQIVSSDTRHDNIQIPSENSEKENGKLILVEEFPNTFTRSSNALDSFRATILQYLAENVPENIFSQGDHSKISKTPLILIMSETFLTISTSSADSFTAHRLLGPEILNHPGVSAVEFNPIAPTFLTKALELVLQKEARHSRRRRIPGPAVLKQIGEVGDIRSAIGSLEFLCLRGDDDGNWGGRVAAKPKRGASSNTVLTKSEKVSLEAVTQREASLGMFHAVGKVVYNKRDDPSFNSHAVIKRPPRHLNHHDRPKLSQVDPDTLIDETGTDTQTFIAALHENYVLSCASADEESFIDSFNGCIDAFSDSDLLTPTFSSNRSNETSTIRQDEICFQVAVRGLLFSLPYPVKRAVIRNTNASGKGRFGSKGDAFKMFYPTSMRLWRAREEIEEAVEVFRYEIITIVDDDKVEGTGRKEDGSIGEMWNEPPPSTIINARTFMQHPSSPQHRRHYPQEIHYPHLPLSPLLSATQPQSQPQTNTPLPPPTFTTGGTHSLPTLVLDRLPYTYKIISSQSKFKPNHLHYSNLSNLSKQKQNQIEKAVIFYGVDEGPTGGGESDFEDAEEVGAGVWGAGGSGVGISSVGISVVGAKGWRRNRQRKEEMEGGEGSFFNRGGGHREKLFLEEDDIVDD
ncbi:MAG: Cell cycle checkpoint protein rad17 [Cirrosporium novae-zelandiae]|nr:MAG: Cell cycle checkpoint protein rad17 [Cirrosporium novae-zelandiae]